MTKYQRRSQADEDFLNKLSEHPELRERFEGILGLARNECGEAQTADEAEERAVQEVRQLGQEVLESWARSKREGLENKYNRRVGYRRKEKKTLLADATRSSGANGADILSESDGETSETV